MEKATLITRIMLGLCLVIVPLLGLFNKAGRTGMPVKAQHLMDAFSSSGYLLYLIWGTQLGIGVLLLTGYFVPLAVICLVPLSVNILLFHLFLSPPAGPGLFVFLLNGFLLWAYRFHYFPLLQP